MAGNRLAIVQSRLGSSRLPGKVLMPLAGQPLVWHIYDRLAQVNNLDVSVIATTDLDSDRPLVDYCQQAGIEVYAHHGAEDNLLARYISCGDMYDADIIVLVCGDCPLIHPPTIEKMVAELEADSTLDYCSPGSDSIEGGVAVLRLRVFKKIAQISDDSAHLEHASLYVTEHPEEFKIIQVDVPEKFKQFKHRLWLDTPSDYRFLKRIYDDLYQPGSIVNLYDVIDLLLDKPEIRAINQEVMQKPVRLLSSAFYLDANGLDKELLLKALDFADSLVNRYQAKVSFAPLDQTEYQQLVTERLFAVQKNDPVYLISFKSKGSQALAIEGIDTGIQFNVNLSKMESALGYMGLYLGAVAEKAQVVSFSCEICNSHLQRLTKCPVCGSDDVQAVYEEPEQAEFHVCCQCGHQYSSWFNDKKLPDYQEFKQHHSNESLLDQKNDFFEIARIRQAKLSSYLDSQDYLLEIGCGYGHFIKTASEVYNVHALEPSLSSVRFAREKLHAANIWPLDYGQLPDGVPLAPKAGYKAICSFHVLEHVNDPVSFLRYAYSQLADNGYLFISVPDAETLSIDFIEIHFLLAGLHLHTFSKNSLCYLAQQCGFEVIECIPEQTTAALRSSMLLVAKKKLAVHSVNNGEHSVMAAKNYFHKLNDFRQRIRQAFAQWHKNGKKVAIYGSGIHSASVLSHAVAKEHWPVWVIDDDESKYGRRVFGLETNSLHTVLKCKPDVIIVSTLSADQKILNKLRAMELPGIAIHGIYEL